MRASLPGRLHGKAHYLSFSYHACSKRRLLGLSMSIEISTRPVQNVLTHLFCKKKLGLARKYVIYKPASTDWSKQICIKLSISIITVIFSRPCLAKAALWMRCCSCWGLLYVYNVYGNLTLTTYRPNITRVNSVFTYRVGQKKRDHRLITIILWNLNRLKIFLLENSLVNLQLNGY